MSELILVTKTLPEPLYRRIRSDKVRVREEDGNIILTPVFNTDEPADLWGLLPDSKFTTEKYLAQKRRDKELEQ
ncbi:MAG: hypothetical protein FWE91_09480 [Defluviitaleaceae bacterium]|nr:hypothetical protein [Defluviitaleaceae bacterium]